jgi:Tol biopolymer transport system component
VVQGGAIYRLRHGSFQQITREDGWMQPSLSPNGSRLVAVKRSLNRSDLFLLGPLGRTLVQLTRNDSTSVETNHWVFYPRYSPDGASVYFSYDPKDPYNSYRVDLAIYATSAVNPSAPASRWTQPNEYTGGDIYPVPLQTGGLVYTKYSIDQQSVGHSQVWVQATRGSPGLGLTKPADDCSQPALSADETQIAMVCRHGGLQSADLEVESFDGSSLTLRHPNVVVRGTLVAAPSFSPDGRLLAYFAPAEAGGPFQLWTVDPNATTTHGSRQITTSLDLDPSAPPAWAGA